MTGFLLLYALIVLGLTAAEYKQKRQVQSWLKPLAAISFILIAVFGGALYWDYGRWVIAALVACAVGDVLLLSRESLVRFKLGMLAFALGHIFYIVAMIALAQQFDPGLLFILPLMAGIVFFAWLKPHLPKDMIAPVAIYSGIIIAMAGLSFSAPKWMLFFWMVPLAAIMFSVSDMFVARDRFVKEEGKNALAITPLYFGAQALFAISAAIAV